MLFAVGGVYMITDGTESRKFVIKIIVGCLGVIFFGGGGLFLGVITLYNAIKHIPYLIIYEDRVKQYVQFKAAYDTIFFADVKSFRLMNINGAMHIAIDYKDPYILKKQKSKTTSGIVKRLMAFNFKVTRAIATIYVSNLSMKGEDICRLLNERLERQNKSEEK